MLPGRPFQVADSEGVLVANSEACWIADSERAGLTSLVSSTWTQHLRRPRTRSKTEVGASSVVDSEDEKLHSLLNHPRGHFDLPKMPDSVRCRTRARWRAGVDSGCDGRPLRLIESDMASGHNCERSQQGPSSATFVQPPTCVREWWIHGKASASPNAGAGALCFINTTIQPCSIPAEPRTVAAGGPIASGAKLTKDGEASFGGRSEPVTHGLTMIATHETQPDPSCNPLGHRSPV